MHKSKLIMLANFRALRRLSFVFRATPTLFFEPTELTTLLFVILQQSRQLCPPKKNFLFTGMQVQVKAMKVTTQYIRKSVIMGASTFELVSI